MVGFPSSKSVVRNVCSPDFAPRGEWFSESKIRCPGLAPRISPGPPRQYNFGARLFHPFSGRHRRHNCRRQRLWRTIVIIKNVVAIAVIISVLSSSSSPASSQPHHHRPHHLATPTFSGSSGRSRIGFVATPPSVQCSRIFVNFTAGPRLQLIPAAGPRDYMPLDLVTNGMRHCPDPTRGRWDHEKIEEMLSDPVARLIFQGT